MSVDLTSVASLPQVSLNLVIANYDISTDRSTPQKKNSSFLRSKQSDNILISPGVLPARPSIRPSVLTRKYSSSIFLISPTRDTSSPVKTSVFLSDRSVVTSNFVVQPVFVEPVFIEPISEAVANSPITSENKSVSVSSSIVVDSDTSETKALNVVKIEECSVIQVVEPEAVPAVNLLAKIESHEDVQTPQKVVSSFESTSVKVELSPVSVLPRKILKRLVPPSLPPVSSPSPDQFVETSTPMSSTEPINTPPSTNSSCRITRHNMPTSRAAQRLASSQGSESVPPLGKPKSVSSLYSAAISTTPPPYQSSSEVGRFRRPNDKSIESSSPAGVTSLRSFSHDDVDSQRSSPLNLKPLPSFSRIPISPQHNFLPNPNVSVVKTSISVPPSTEKLKWSFVGGRWLRVPEL